MDKVKLQRGSKIKVNDLRCRRHKMGLLLEKSAGPCTRIEAFNEELIPESTHSYVALPNEHLVKMVHDVAKLHGLKLTNERLGLDLKGMRFFGVVDVEGKSFFENRIRLMVGFCNSYNKSMSARVCIGGTVIVCSNMAFHAYTDELSGVTGIAAHEHRINIYDGLFQRIKAAFDTIETFRKVQNHFYKRLTDERIKRDKANSIIVQAAQAGVINKTRILSIVNEWEYQEVAPKDRSDGREWHSQFQSRNAYSLFNAFTQVQKDRMTQNPVQANIQTLGLTKFFVDQFRIKNN